MASYGQLLNAPSYDDANIFDQVDIQPSSSPKHKVEQKHEQKQDAAKTRVVVDDPVKRTEQTIIPGMSGGYMTYRVSTTTSLQSYAQKSFSVRRRFRDVVVRISRGETSYSLSYRGVGRASRSFSQSTAGTYATPFFSKRMCCPCPAQA